MYLPASPPLHPLRRRGRVRRLPELGIGMCLQRRRIRQSPPYLRCTRRPSWVRRSDTREGASRRPSRRLRRCTSCPPRSRTSTLASCTQRLRPQVASPGTCRNSTCHRPRRRGRRTCSPSSHKYKRGAPRTRRRRPCTSLPLQVAPSGRQDTPCKSTRASLRPRTHRQLNRNRCTGSSSPPHTRSGCPGRSLGMRRRHLHHLRLRRLHPFRRSPCRHCNSQAARGFQPGSTWRGASRSSIPKHSSFAEARW